MEFIFWLCIEHGVFVVLDEFQELNIELKRRIKVILDQYPPGALDKTSSGMLLFGSHSYSLKKEFTCYGQPLYAHALNCHLMSQLLFDTFAFLQMFDIKLRTRLVYAMLINGGIGHYKALAEANAFPVELFTGDGTLIDSKFWLVFKAFYQLTSNETHYHYLISTEAFNVLQAFRESPRSALSISKLKRFDGIERILENLMQQKFIAGSQDRKGNLNYHITDN